MEEETEQNKPRKKQTLPKAIRREEFKQLIRIVPAKDNVFRTAALLSYGAGLRLSEVLNLRREEVTDKIFVSQGKYSKDRVVPIPKGWKSYMIRLLPLKCSGRTLQRKFRKYADKAKLNPKYSFHSLRHGFATAALEAGIPINHLQFLLGHSNVSTTNVYIRANPIDALRSYEELF